MFEIVDEELVAILIGGIAKALHRLIFKRGFLIAETAEFQLIRPGVLGEVAGGTRAGPASTIRTSKPCSVSSFATQPPLAPEPTTRTS